MYEPPLHSSQIHALPQGVEFRIGWHPGLIGWIIQQHGLYYSHHWHLGAAFEALVAHELGALMLRFDAQKDAIFSLYTPEGPIASLTLDGGHGEIDTKGARIRFFLIAEPWQGQGFGRFLMREAMSVIEQQGLDRAFLTTFKGLEAARSLYEKFQFKRVEEKYDTHWGMPLFEQEYHWRRPDTIY